MTEIPINLADDHDEHRMIQLVERVLIAHGLTMSSRGALKQYPGGTHWHWTRGRERGTLEVTLWPARRRLWFKVQARRAAPWIDQLLPVLKAALEKG